MTEYIRIGSQKFAIISNNCWGAEAYAAVRRPYNTPFVGLYLHPDCYLRFLENFNKFLEADISFGNSSRYFEHNSKYPVGYLCDNVEIHFLHYSSKEEALEKWVRRTGRLREAFANDVSLYFKLCDREGCSTSHLKRFHALPFKNKISIGIQPYPSLNHLCVPDLKSHDEEAVITGLSLFRKRYRYFDFAQWILTARCKATIYSRLLQLIS